MLLEYIGPGTNRLPVILAIHQIVCNGIWMIDKGQLSARNFFPFNLE